MKQQQTNKHYVPSRTLRSSGSSLLLVPRVRTGFGSRSFSVATPIIYSFGIPFPWIFETVLPYPVFAANLKPSLTNQLFGLLSAPSHLSPAPQIRLANRRHCALYKFFYLLTYLLTQKLPPQNMTTSKVLL